MSLRQYYEDHLKSQQPDNERIKTKENLGEFETGHL
jgi:hypothetical protein